MAEREYVLWGFHPNYGGPLGIVPIRLTRGPLRHVRGEQNRRIKDGGWILGIYAAGVEPVGLRMRCREIHGTPKEVDT